MLNILAAILLFGLIVLIHEFGHFLLAKLNGIGVLEFSIGMGPRLASFVRGETRYSIKLLPFGGSCAMLGEDAGDPALLQLQCSRHKLVGKPYFLALDDHTLNPPYYSS